MNFQQQFFERVYRRAGTPDKLPWHREEPPDLLVKAASARGRGRALDVGCGAGSFSIWLAKHGFDVTGIDFSAAALDLARESAKAANADVRFERADVLEWRGEGFDVVLDSGCLHSVLPRQRARYRQRLFEWLAPGGDYVLQHFEKRHAFDLFPMGPQRRTREELETELAPLALIETTKREIDGGPLRLLGRNSILQLWFRR